MTFFLGMEKWCPATPAGAILPYSSFGTCLRIAANATSREPSAPGGVGSASVGGGTLPAANGFASDSTGDAESAGAENGPGGVDLPKNFLMAPNITGFRQHIICQKFFSGVNPVGSDIANFPRADADSTNWVKKVRT